MKMLKVPSVTMNGGSLSRVTNAPLMAPATAPARMPSARAKIPGIPFFTAKLAISSDERIAMAPTDRSMPAVRMTNV